VGKQYRVTVVTPVVGELPQASSFQRVHLVHVSPWAIWRLLKRLAPTDVLVGHAHPKLLAGAWLWGRYAVLAYGNDFLAAQQRWHRPFFNYLLRQAKPLIAISRATAVALGNIVNQAPVIIYPGTEPARFFPNPRRQLNETPILLTVGRLVPRKGIDLMLRALPLILQETAVTYHIGGSGPDHARLEKLVQESGIQHAVRFLGRIPDDELPHLYASADLFVMPNREIQAEGSLEGFGIVFLEASASGLPVIAGRSGGAVEAVQDGITGLLVAPDSVEELATAVLTLLRDAPKRQQMGQAGRQWVETEMNWDRTARQFMDLLARHSA
jgi:phosphatidylinositol alpha-1,6-mannosyltransferase